MMAAVSDILKILQDGNQRFVSGKRNVDNLSRALMANVNSQKPHAIILGCSDSRVPVEIIFDQGLGDLFVIRVAGNIVAPSQIGSIEFAAQQFSAPLVVVLGHSMCGAVLATIDELSRAQSIHSSNVLSIVNRIRPSIEPLFNTDLRHDKEKFIAACVRANILISVNNIKHGSPMVAQLIQQNKLTVVGAQYSLETGKVDFYL